MPIPRHIAIIPDGNRRWAKKKGWPAFFGHREGVKALEKILLTALELNIPYFTFWGCSISNVTKRSKEEVAFLFKLFEVYFKKLAANKTIPEHQIRIRALGRWGDYFPPAAQASINLALEKTKDYNRHHLTFLLAYNGTEEMITAVNAIVANTPRDAPLEGGENPSTHFITEQTIKQYLYTKDLPPVDLAIRTGGDPHFSTGFMMWDLTEAQLYFSDKMWPEFTPEDFQTAVADYSQRARRLGA